MWKGLEGEVEIILEFGIGQPFRLRERVPDMVEILREGGLEVGERCGT